MTNDATGKCEVCGKPGCVHLAEIGDAGQTNRSFCLEHAPAEIHENIRERMPFGPHRTPAEEVAILRNQMAMIDERAADPAQRAEFKAELEKLIAEIEAGRRRLGDTEQE